MDVTERKAINKNMKHFISSRKLGLLPHRFDFYKTSQSIAMLDAILEPEWEFRYYSFNLRWNNNEQMASMRDGCGDYYFILFNLQGTIITGHSHNSLMGKYAIKNGKPWPGVIDNAPEEFIDVLSEPAFSIGNASFFIWCKRSDEIWNIGNIKFPKDPDPDGSRDLLFMFDGKPQTYHKWAEEYYDKNLSLAAVKAIYAHTPLTKELIEKLNEDISFEDLKKDVSEIGYPYINTT